MKNLGLVIAVVVMSIVAGCSQAPEPTKPSNEIIARGSISGSIGIGPSLLPLSGAIVSLNTDSASGGYSTQSDSSGHFTIPDVLAGKYTLTITANGYRTYTRKVDIAIDQDVFLTDPVRLFSKYSRITGKILSQDSIALSGVLVSVSGSSGSTTDSSGLFSVQLLADSTYRLTLIKEGFKDSSLVATAPGSEMVDSLKIFLKRKRFIVSGKITDSSGSAITGVAALLKKGSISRSALSGSDGKFSFTDVPEDTFTLTLTHAQYQTRTLPQIVIIKDTTLSDIKTSPALNQRSLSGYFSVNGSRVDSVAAEITGSGISGSQWLPCVFSAGGTYSYSAFFNTPMTGGNWVIVIRGYDSGKRKISQSQPVSVSSSSGDVVIPPFDGQNAVPNIYVLGIPDTVNIRDTFTVSPVAADSFGGTISTWQWKFGNSIVSGKNAKYVISTASKLTAILTVTDNDGNLFSDTGTITAVNTIPVVSEMTLSFPSLPVTALQFNISGQEKNGGRISLCRFDFDNNGSWDTVISYNTTNAIVAAVHDFKTAFGKAVTVRAQIMDDDSNYVSRSIKIFERLYVKSSGVLPVRNGLTWATAYASLSDAIASAKTYSFREIWLSSGTYPQTSIGDSLNVFGGFTGSETLLTQRVRSDLDGDGHVSKWEYTNASIFTGGNQQRVVTLTGAAVLNGCVIQDGNIDVYFQNLPTPSRGAGALVDNNAQLNSCIIRNNVTWHLGGGVYCNNGVVENCLIEKNKGNGGGGGVYLVNGSIRNCVIRNDTTAGSGGGIHVIGATSPTVFGTLLVKNKAGYRGGGCYVSSTAISTRLINLTVAQNWAGYTGGVHITATPTSANWMCNSALAGNTDTGSTQDQFNFDFTSTPGDTGVRVYRCAVEKYSSGSRYFSTSEQVIQPTALSTVTINNFFISPSTGDYRAKTTDPYMSLINNGSNTFVPVWGLYDLDDKIRKNGTVDVGAYEQ